MRRVDRLFERVTELPFSPVVIKILELAREERAGAREIAKLIAQDQGFTARLLKIANSPYYGQARPVTTVAQAVPVLGFDTIFSLALALNTFTSNAPDDGAILTLRDLWEHAMSCACWARQIARRTHYPVPEEVFVAGLLHDMGQALFYRYFKTEFLEAVMNAWSEKVSLLETERNVFGVDHQSAGAVVAQRWNLPPLLIQTIEYHHQPHALPEEVDARVHKTVAIVHVADVLAHGSPIGRGIEDNYYAVDDAVWAFLQLQEADCRELSECVMSEVEEFRKIIDVSSNSRLLRGQREGQAGRPAGRFAVVPVKSIPAKVDGKSSADLTQSADAEAFARVMEAGKQLSLLAGLDDLYPNIVGQATMLLNVEAAHLFLPRDDALEIVGAAGLSELRGKIAPMERSLSGWVAKMGETIVLPDIEKAAASWEKEFFKAAGFRAHLFLPVDWAGNRLAVLGLHARAQRRWTARETATAKAFADFVAVALENARLYREAEDRVKTLAELNRKLEEALHVKSRFFATMSHELRSPLFVITGYASLIGEQVFGPLPAELSDAVAKITKQASGLITRITQILEISQLDAGTFIFHHDSFDLAEFLAEVSQQVGNLIGDKPIIFEGRYSDEPFVIVSDRPRLSQILGHILDNAAKFTHEGKIVLCAAASQDGVEIIVEDSGIGIDPEYQKIIFDDFRQVEEEDNRRYEGLGLGLHLSRRMLELLGGKISLESEVGKGSRFRLWLPRGDITRASENPV